MKDVKTKDINCGKIDVLEDNDEKITDPQMVIKKVRTNLSNFCLASDELRNNKEFVNKLLNNKSIIAKTDGNKFAILEYIGDKLKKDKDFARLLMKRTNKNSYIVLKYLDKELLEDEELILHALDCEYNGETNIYEFIGDGLKKDKEFLLKLIKKRYNYYSLLDKSIKDDYDFNYNMVLQNNNMFKYINKKFRSNDRFINILKVKAENEKEKFGRYDFLYEKYQRYIWVDKRNDKKVYYDCFGFGCKCDINNKIIINEQYCDSIIKKSKNSDKLELDFTLLYDSDISRKCNSLIHSQSFEHINNVWIINFSTGVITELYEENNLECFEIIIEKMFNKLKGNVSWYYKKTKILDSKYAYYPNYYPYYPVDVIRLFYDDGMVADEYILNSSWLYDKKELGPYI